MLRILIPVGLKLACVCIASPFVTWSCLCRAHALLDHYNRLEGSEEQGSVFVQYACTGQKAAVTRTPEQYEPSNILGLQVIKAHEFLTYNPATGCFNFTKPFPAYL